jgi:outer membrane protein assembly factor BamB
MASFGIEWSAAVLQTRRSIFSRCRCRYAHSRAPFEIAVRPICGFTCARIMRSENLKFIRPATILVCILFFCAESASRAQSVTNILKISLPGKVASSSPAISSDGNTIYQATFNGTLLAISPQGSIRWKFKAAREVKSSPAIADDGTIYFGSRDRKFYAVTPQGKLKWTFATGAWIDSSPAIGADGTIYFGSWDKKFYALNPDGSKKWEFVTGNIIVSSPAIAADGTIYFGSHDKKLYALKPDGTMKWNFLTGGEIISSPAIAADGTVYFTSLDGNFYALHPDGTERWRLHTGDITESSPVLDENGNIYISVSGLDNSHDFSISPDGKKNWDWTTPVPINASPAVAASGLIYFSWPWRSIVAVQPSQPIVWQVIVDDNLSSSPVIGGDGTIYVTAESSFFAFNSTNQLAPLAKSPWPMFRANPRHTGRVQIVK